MPGFRKKKCFVFWLSGPYGTSNFDCHSLIFSDLNYTTFHCTKVPTKSLTRNLYQDLEDHIGTFLEL